jgi:hypothetical protein
MGGAPLVIAGDIEASRALAVRIGEVSAHDGLAPEIVKLCAAVSETIVDPDFPGALVPAVGPKGAVHIFAAAPSAPLWRGLSPVLLAFAGPTLTSFSGVPGELPAGDTVADLVCATRPAVTATLRLPDDAKSQITALRALARMRETFARAPSLQRDAPKSTSWLLACFQDMLNVGRREAAAEILDRLRDGLRLDALNLKFLEVQLLATFGEWSAIVDLPGFANLCVARRPPAVTVALLEALYHVHVEAAFDAEDVVETRSRFECHIRLLAQPMLSVPPPASLTAAGWRLFGLEAWIAPGRQDILAALSDCRDELGWLATQVSAAESVAESAAQESPLDVARGALAVTDAVESIDATAAVLAALEQLNADELVRLRSAEPFRSLLQAVQAEVTEVGLPRNWLEWLAKAADPAFTNALDVARRGKDEWPIEDQTADPMAVRALLSALETAQNDDLAAERTAQALPFIVAWARRDSAFPRPALALVYGSLLTLFALGTARGRNTYESSQILVAALLSGGLDGKSYRALIADVEELASAGFGLDMIYWVLELVEEFMRASAPDADARELFFHRALSKMAPLYSRLSGLQRAAIARLSTELGWPLGSLGIETESIIPDDLATQLQGLRVAIYSLTESSSRQAKAAIEEVAPTAIVDCNADHGGTPRLRALAENVDLFVMSWLSAKHAATDFIRKHRGGRPLLYAQGRGFSSILRAIEDHLT